jgi:predicted anti-sigma-YlaC factor YlaD
MSNEKYICRKENIAAYIDGDLEPASRSAFEVHLEECASCTSELQAQQLFMCELDSALANPTELAVPANFARVVAVNAASDMSGARSAVEHARALRFCVILGLAAFALLGVASSKALLLSAQSVSSKIFGVLSLLGQAVFNAVAGLTVISRVISRGLIPESRLGGLGVFLLIALAVGILSVLISRYHRTRLTE